MKMNHNHLLLIDDDADDRLIFIDALSEIGAGIECAIAKNGLDAIEYLKTAIAIPSLIFLDLNMPFMNGLQCLEKIKKDERLKHLPIIVYTTSDNPIDKKRTKELGAEMFFTKTPNFKLLKDTLLQILKTYF